MKYIVLLGDGMADLPIDALEGKTPLQVARTPNMDSLARGGEIGLVRTVPEHFSPGSDVANLSVLGYTPETYFTGRAPLEAASMGIELSADDVAFRCNLVTIEKEQMTDFSAGHISTAEAKVLIEDLERNLSDHQISFYAGVSYRHLMVWRHGKDGAVCTPPHDITGQAIGGFLPVQNGAEVLNDLMLRARTLLKDHRINRERFDQGKRPANAIWLWGQGKRPSMPTFQEKYGLSGAVISAVDLLKGIGIYAGLLPVDVPGATGYFDTNYEGKAMAAIEALKTMDFVYVHVEAADEAGHMGDLEEKIRAIENFDEKVVGTVLKEMHNFEAIRVLLMPDHPTPISMKTHSKDMAPFVIFDSGDVKNTQRAYDEPTAREAGLVIDPGYLIMDRLIRGESEAQA
jgi:2,3-bisphosphoglycerate-independent phosphoglycerate mutase